MTVDYGWGCRFWGIGNTDTFHGSRAALIEKLKTLPKAAECEAWQKGLREEAFEIKGKPMGVLRAIAELHKTKESSLSGGATMNNVADLANSMLGVVKPQRPSLVGKLDELSAQIAELSAQVKKLSESRSVVVNVTDGTGALHDVW